MPSGASSGNPSFIDGLHSRTAAWGARWFETRNRLIAEPRFQRWAATFPLTRRTAARRAANLFDICAGFVYSQVLFAVVELKLPSKLVDGPKPVATLAPLCGLEPDAMRRLLRAAAPLTLVEDRGNDTFGLGTNGAALVGNPAIEAMVAHHTMLYRDLADPVALFKSGEASTELSRFWAYATAETPDQLATGDIASYSELMSSSLALLADDVLDAFTLAGHACLLDVGGGGGDFLVAVAQRRREMRMMLFDLPAVAARAEARFVADHLDDRARAIGGDFKRDPLPVGADAISLVRVAHDLDDEALDALLAKICAALPRNGVLLLAEPMAGTRGAEKVGTYFTMYLRAMKRGHPRSAAELKQRLAASGFAHVQQIPTARPMLASLLVARKSAYPHRSNVLTD